MNKTPRTMVMKYSSVQERVKSDLPGHLGSLRLFDDDIDETMSLLDKQITGPIDVGRSSKAYVNVDKFVIETSNEFIEFPLEEFKLNFSSFAKNSIRDNFDTDSYWLEKTIDIMTIKIKN